MKEVSGSIILSVSEFIEYINLALGGRRVVIEGEVSGFSINQGKWVFFSLKDEQSIVSCFCMKYQLDVAIEDGMQIRAYGVPRIYGKSGKFSVVVDKVELAGMGALKRAFELTKAKLEKEGIFDVARKRQLPFAPHRIGLICSRESAAYTDFMRILNNRWGGIDIHLAHVHVQGDSAIKEIVGAFEFFNTSDLGIEALVLIRGGGSLEDLQAFNSESVARAVFGSKIPVVCGVGHERDESLADYAADVRAATPTHAATLLVPDRVEIGKEIVEIEHRLSREMSLRIQECSRNINQIFFFDSFLKEQQTVVEYSCKQLMSKINAIFNQKNDQLAFLSRSLEHMNPLTVVKRGYSIVRKKGRVCASKDDLRPNDQIDITMRDGDIAARVISPQRELF